jgi:hypothetical protein
MLHKNQPVVVLTCLSYGVHTQLLLLALMGARGWGRHNCSATAALSSSTVPAAVFRPVNGGCDLVSSAAVAGAAGAAAAVALMVLLPLLMLPLL